MELKLIVNDNEAGIRIDKYISEKVTDISRANIKRQIDNNTILVNNKPVKASYNVKSSDKILINEIDPIVPDIVPEDIPLDILYEDDDIIVVNKPKGMVVHPAPGHYTGTLVNALMYHCADSLSGINGVLRPGIVHRIDMNTTGVLVACKNDYSHTKIAEQLKVHSITRSYHAIVLNHLKEDEGTITTTIGRNPKDRKKMAMNVKDGREAITHYKVINNLNNRYTYIECRLETGRTHQIRVSMAGIGHPVLGDDVYGPSKSEFNLNGQTLHAKTLGFIHPRTNQYMEFDAPLPEYFVKLLEIIKNKA